MYWENIWDSLKLYKKYSLSFFYISEVISYFLNENTYYHLVSLLKVKDKLNKGEVGTDPIFIEEGTSNPLKHFFLGKILILQNQGWTLILVNYYITKRRNIYPRYDDIPYGRRLFKSFRKNIKLFKYRYRPNIMKYKYCKNYKKKF